MLRLSSSNVFFAELSIRLRASVVITTRMLAISRIVAWTAPWGRSFPAVAAKKPATAAPVMQTKATRAIGSWVRSETPTSPIRALEEDRKLSAEAVLQFPCALCKVRNPP